MSTNLYVSFDAAFGTTGPSHLPRLRHRVRQLIAGLAAARRQRRRAAAVRDLPPHLLKDLGVVRWDGRLWQAHEQLLATDRAPLAGRIGAADRPVAGCRRLGLCD